MKKKFNDKKLAIIIMVILISTALFPIINAQRTDQFKKNKKDQSNTGDPDTATVYIKKYDTKNRQYINEPICSLKKREAEQLRDELYQAEKKYNTNMEKLDKQLSILHNWGIVPPHITIQDFLVIKEKMENFFNFPTSTYSIAPHVIYCGPSLTSFFTLGGSFYVLHQFLWKLLPPYLYEAFYGRSDILNGTRFAGWIGITPVLALYCPAMTLINAAGFVYGPHTAFSPFMALMVLYVGFGIAVSIFDDGYPYNLFDWGVGVSLTGVIVYIMENSPD